MQTYTNSFANNRIVKRNEMFSLTCIYLHINQGCKNSSHMCTVCKGKEDNSTKTSNGSNPMRRTCPQLFSNDDRRKNLRGFTNIRFHRRRDLLARRQVLNTKNY